MSITDLKIVLKNIEAKKEVVSRIIDFRCSKCNQVLDKLPDAYKKAIGE